MVATGCVIGVFLDLSCSVGADLVDGCIVGGCCCSSCLVRVEAEGLSEGTIVWAATKLLN